MSRGKTQEKCSRKTLEEKKKFHAMAFVENPRAFIARLIDLSATDPYLWERACVLLGDLDIPKLFSESNDTFVDFMHQPTEETFKDWRQEIARLLAEFQDEEGALTVERLTTLMPCHEFFKALLHTEFSDFKDVQPSVCIEPRATVKEVEDVDEHFRSAQDFVTIVRGIMWCVDEKPTFEMIAEERFAEVERTQATKRRRIE